MREKILMNTGYKFIAEDIANPPSFGHKETYMMSKSVRGRGPASPSYYDSDWADVVLPHDYVIDGEYAPEHNGPHGSLHRDNAWYRRQFALDSTDADKKLSLIFEGVGKNTQIWINGHLMGSNSSMYNTFEIDFTAVAKVPGINTLAVYINNADFEGWWYEGAGIYRNVWLLKTNSLRLNWWNNYIHSEHIKDNDFKVYANGVLENYSATDRDVTLKFYIKESKNTVELGQFNVTVPANDFLSYEESFDFAHATRWSPDHPFLYHLTIAVVEDGTVIDELDTNIGFRTIEFTPNHGVFINDQPLKLKGVCIHQDHGSLGVAVPAAVEEYRIKKLKEMGANAYRCAHNNPSINILDLCDKYGLVVIDENRWFETSRDAFSQIESMVKRDRNHPSVIAWSAGNEEPTQSTVVGKHILEEIKMHIKRLDRSRPVTLALNGGFYGSHASHASDVLSINYAINYYDKSHEIHSDKCILVTEAAAASTIRGVYFPDDTSSKLTAYDEHFPTFGGSFRHFWQEVDTRDHIAGIFYWTGIEYRGESTYPQLIAAGGGLDSCCFEKENFYLLQAFWKDEPILHVFPHWNLIGHEGDTIKVMTYSNLDEVEIIVNGASAGKQAVNKYDQNEWNIAYEPGELIAIGYKDGSELKRVTLKTTKTATNIHIVADNKANFEGVAILRVYATDIDGLFVPDCAIAIDHQIENGVLLGSSNGNPLDHTPVKSSTHNLHAGLLQIIAKQTSKDAPLKVTVSTAFMTAELVDDFYSVAAKQVPSLVTKDKLDLDGFRVWAPSVDTDVIARVNYNDMNTSFPFKFGTDSIADIFSHSAGMAKYTTQILVPNYVGNKNISIVIDGVHGDTSIYIAHADNPWPGSQPRKPHSTQLLQFDDPHGGNITVPLKHFFKNEKIVVHIINNDKITGRIYWSLNPPPTTEA